ncbi:MAG: hypothetical protein Q9M16_06390 [Mariprofundus sp.]|nr:hypothetical protein [Mariprofundus sp.]
MKRNSVIALLLVLLLSVACSDATQGADKTVSLYPDQQSAGFKQFAKQCSACHRPPMPNIHPANLWVTTLYRMQKHRRQRGLVIMTDAEQQQVLAYLQSHSQ